MNMKKKLTKQWYFLYWIFKYYNWYSRQSIFSAFELWTKNPHTDFKRSMIYEKKQKKIQNSAHRLQERVCAPPKSYEKIKYHAPYKPNMKWIGYA